MNVTEHYYSPKELTAMMDISDSTLRKWCLALEEHRYYFSRTDNKKRVFTDRDVVVLKQLQNLIQIQHLSHQNAAMIVANRYREDASEHPNSENSVPAIRSDSEIITKLNSELDTLKEQQEQLITLNKQLIQRLDEREKYIDERLNQQQEALLESINELKQDKKILLEHQKEGKSKRKGIFHLFSKNKKE